MSQTIKCLSVWQPWAWLIVNGHKNVENRGWWTRYRGPLLIHASKKMDLDAGRRMMYRDGFNTAELPLGCIVGQVEIVDCTLKKSSKWHNPDQYGWYLRNAIAFDKPIPYRGRQGLFDVPVSVVPELRAA